MKLKYFDIARKTSFKSPSRFKLGTVIVKGSKIVNSGFNNMEKTHPKAATWGNFIHSEIHALLGTKYKETKGSVAYIYRETANGNLANSRPCPVCMNCLRISGVKTIYYTVNNGFEKEDI